MRPQTPTILRCLATTDAVTDADLLARFVASHDQAAFELLVWRHARMVLRVCRGILGDHHAAEDACQAVFLALARQAGTVGRGAVVGWLYRVARRAAQRAAVRRVPAGPSDLLDQFPAPIPAAEMDPALIRALHDEVAALPEQYRVPVLLCFFEGLTHRAAAERLGLPDGTLATRVARARDRLQRRLSARGFGISVGLLTAALTAGSATATFLATVAQSAVAFATGGDPEVSETILELAKGAIRPMIEAKIRWTVGIVAVCAAVALGGLWVAGKEDPPKQPKVAPVGEQPLAFKMAALNADDLADALSLNIYKFNVDLPKGQKFHVVLRELDDKDAAPRELKRFSFQKGDKDGPTTMRIDFKPMGGAAGGVLLTEQKEAVFNVSCPGCQPSGLTSVVPVPLSGVKLTERTLFAHQSDKDNKKSGVKETLLLSIVSNVKGTGAMNYPRAELLIEKE